MKKVYGYVCLTAVLFGMMEVALKVAGGGMDSFQLTFLRFAIGGLLLLPFGLAEIKQKGIKINGKDMGWLLLVGIMGIPISMLFFQLGVVNSNASTASVLICLNPLFTMVIAHFFAGEPMNRIKVLSFAIGVAGIVFMIRPWNLQPGNTPIGIIFMLIAAITFSIYTVMSKKSVAKLGVMAQTSISFLLGSSVLLIIIIAMRKPVLEGVWTNIWLVLFIGVMVTGVGYWSYFMAIRNSDASTGSIAFFIKPAIAPVFAVVILHESLLWSTIVGIGLILTASFINLNENKRLNKLSERDKS